MQPLLKTIWKLFTSIRLTVVLLLTLAGTSVIGTLIPQNQNPAEYFRVFGDFFSRLFSVLGFYDLYHSWWFQALIVLLTANIIICSIDRLSAIWQIVFVRNPSFRISKFRGLQHKEEFCNDRSPEFLEEVYLRFISRTFGTSRVEKTEHGYCIFGEKGRWTRLGVYAVHLSIVALLLGGLIGSLFGFEGYVNIPEGESVRNIYIGNAGKTLPLDFEIRCDDFDVSFYDTGAPKEFRSSLTLLEQGKVVRQKDIIVNDPLRFKGVNMFQSSYGRLPPKDLTLRITSRSTGMIYPVKVTLGKAVNLPENQGTLILKELENSANFRGNPIGAAFKGTLTPNDGNPVDILLPLRFPSFDKMRKGELVLSVAQIEQWFYTGLQVTRDPGVWLVYLGFIMMIIGCYVTFFMSHQQVCVEVVEEGTSSRVFVRGTANKNKMGMENRVKIISDKLKKLTPQEISGRQECAPHSPQSLGQNA